MHAEVNATYDWETDGGLGGHDGIAVPSETGPPDVITDLANIVRAAVVRTPRTGQVRPGNVPSRAVVAVSGSIPQRALDEVQ